METEYPLFSHPRPLHSVRDARFPNRHTGMKKARGARSVAEGEEEDEGEGAEGGIWRTIPAFENGGFYAFHPTARSTPCRKYHWTWARSAHLSVRIRDYLGHVPP